MYFVEERRKGNKFKNFDIVTFLPIVFLAIFGLLVVKSATMTRIHGGTKMMIVQTLTCVLGIGIAIAISFFDYRSINVLINIAYIGSCFLLILVLIVGRGDGIGSRSWIRIAGVTIQPAEFSKVTFILMTSRYLVKLKEISVINVNDLLRLIIVVVVPIGLVLVQKDFGTACVFFAIFFVLLFVYGIKMKYIFTMGGVFLAFMPVMWFFVLNEKRKDRIRVFLNPELDPLGSGMNVLRSKMTIGSGRIFGKGLFKGIQTQNSAVPVKESDFIFSVIGEETGLIVSVIVVLTFLYILLRAIYIAKNSKDMYGKFIVMGFVAMIGAHFVENIGMTIGILPVTGIPLPFISQGGTSMIANFAAVGFILSVSRLRCKKRNKKWYM